MDNQRKLDVFLFENVNLLDIAGPVQAFSSAGFDGNERYSLRYVSTNGAPITTTCGLRLQADAALTSTAAQDLLIPGGTGVDLAMQDTQLRQTLSDWQQSSSDRRLFSICSGALILANAGVLNGLKATTHWSREAQAKRQFPLVQWSTNALFHIEGQIFTSAGVTSGIDLALEIIRRDHGPKLALTVARELVVHLKRNGDQAQYTDLLQAQFSSDADLTRLISKLEANPAHDWTLEKMAECAGLTPRTLTRRFSATTGLTPVKYLERFRLKRATDALSGGAPIATTITVSGFRDFQHMQRAFKRHLGTTVGHYKDSFAAPP